MANSNDTITPKNVPGEHNSPSQGNHTDDDARLDVDQKETSRDSSAQDPMEMKNDVHEKDPALDEPPAEKTLAGELLETLKSVFAKPFMKLLVEPVNKKFDQDVKEPFNRRVKPVVYALAVWSKDVVKLAVFPLWVTSKALWKKARKPATADGDQALDQQEPKKQTTPLNNEQRGNAQAGRSGEPNAEVL